MTLLKRRALPRFYRWKMFLLALTPAFTTAAIALWTVHYIVDLQEQLKEAQEACLP